MASPCSVLWIETVWHFSHKVSNACGLNVIIQTPCSSHCSPIHSYWSLIIYSNENNQSPYSLCFYFTKFHQWNHMVYTIHITFCERGAQNNNYHFWIFHSNDLIVSIMYGSWNGLEKLNILYFKSVCIPRCSQSIWKNLP